MATSNPSLGEPEEPGEIDLEHYKFSYQSLPTATSIRLVRLESVEGYDGPAITMSMRTVDLNDNPEYAALSYTWGRPLSVFATMEERDNVELEDRPIVCDGLVTAVGPNLYGFLLSWKKMLAAAGASTDSERVARARKAGLLPPTEMWIDSLCINQADLEEKATQVTLMGQIYSQTQKVIIWLGPEDIFTRTALQIIFKMQGVTQSQARAVRAMPDSDATKLLGLPPITSSTWWSVFAFFHRAWFRRVWVIQELAFASVIQMQCGLLTFPWDVLSKACGVLYESGLGETMDIWAWAELIGQKLNEPLFLEDLEPIITMSEREDSDRNLFTTLNQRGSGYSFQNIIRLQALRIGDGSRLGDMSKYGYRLGSDSKDLIPSIPILHMFDSTRRSEATDPRDKIYAILDLAKRDTHDSDIASPLRKPLVPNYHLSTEEVYLEAAWYALLSSDDLELLMRTFLVPHDEDSKTWRHNLPSWVPDWSASLAEAPMVTIKPFKESRWSASGDMKWIPLQDASLFSRTLALDGALLDTVVEVAESKGFSLSKSGQVAAGLPQVYPWSTTTVTPGEALWRTLIANYDESAYPARDLNQVFYDSWMDRMKKASREYYSEEGISDPEMHDEWFRFVGHTDTLFPDHEEMNKLWKAKSENKNTSPSEEIVLPADSGLSGSLLSDFQEKMKQIEEEIGGPKLLTAANNDPAGDLPTPVNKTPSRKQPLSQIDRMIEDMTKSVLSKTFNTEEDEENDDTESVESEPSKELTSQTVEDDQPTEGPNIRPPQSAAEREFDHLRDNFSPNRRIFRTEKNFLGNGPHATRPGDQIWIFAGGKVPFVLRPRDGGGYTLVGDTYVHGVMHGELIELLKSSFVKVELT